MFVSVNVVRSLECVFQLATNVSLMCVSVLLNANPGLFILGSYVFKVEASAADAMGKGLVQSANRNSSVSLSICRNEN